MKKIVFISLGSLLLLGGIVFQVVKNIKFDQENKSLYSKIIELETNNQDIKKDADWQRARVDVIEKKLDEYKNAGGMVSSAILDTDVESNVAAIMSNIEDYYNVNNTFKGYVLSETLKQSYRAFMQGCPVTAQVIIDTDNQGYTVYQQLCSDAGKSYCAERHDDRVDVSLIISNTEFIKLNQKCQ